jgi:hypothetical protein
MFNNEETESIADSTDSASSEDSSVTWYFKWKQDLVAIFKKAMELRMEMAMTDGKYDFLFAIPGRSYVFDPSGGLRTSGTSRQKVMLCIRPQVRGRFAKVLGGEKEDWELISKARVCFFGPT